MERPDLYIRGGEVDEESGFHKWKKLFGWR